MENPNEYINSIKNANVNIAAGLQYKIINSMNRLSDDAYEDIKHVNLMLTAIIVNGDEWPMDKSSRWLGFIQAKLVQHNIITLDEERKDTREIFHNIYREQGLDVPQSIDLYSKK
jgi:hypothetical protein